MTDTIQVKRDTMQQLLEIIDDTTKLLEEIPQMQDEGRLSEISQHIGAELEARIQNMHEIQKENKEIKKIIEQISNQGEQTLEELERQVLN